MTKRAWVVLPDLLSIRVFFDTGIVTGLHERLGGRLAAVFLVPRDTAGEWLDRVPGLDALHGDDLTAGDGLRAALPGRVVSVFGVEGWPACGSPDEALRFHGLDGASLAARIAAAAGRGAERAASSAAR